jgi:Na+/proline symporter
MIYLICIFAYLLLLAGIGAYKSRAVNSQEDFVLAGRTLSPWVMVCTMLAVWIGTGSIVGNAEQTYETGMAALILPIGTFLGMILLSFVASRARSIEATTVPEIIGSRFGPFARLLSVLALVIAYMVIVSYQFNAGGAVLEVITGSKPPVTLQVKDELTRQQLQKGRVIYTPEAGFAGETGVRIREGLGNSEVEFLLAVVPGKDLLETKRGLNDAVNRTVTKENSIARLRFDKASLAGDNYTLQSLPENGTLTLVEPVLTARTATIIAAICIVAYTASAGLMSLAYMDILTGSIIAISMLIAFPLYFFKAGGISGMEAAFAAMGDRPQHMQFWGVYSPIRLINYCLPVLLLVLGDANQYQRIFASRNAKGAKSAVVTLIFVAFIIEVLIIACAWFAASMTPDPENGKYILIYAAKHYMPLPLGCLFMVTVVGIIISTADSFLLVPATTVINDLYTRYINPQANERRTIFISRMLVVAFGTIAYLVSLAFSESTGFFQKALYAFTIYGASITPALVAAIVWPRATKAGATTSILVGIIVSLAWSELDIIQQSLPAAWSGLDAVLPGISLSVLSLVVVSLLTRDKAPAEKPA